MRKNKRLAARAPGEETIALTRLVLFWESAYPALLPALAAPAAIAIISLFDLWRFTPVWLHLMGLALAGFWFVAALWRNRAILRFPDRRQAQARLEADGAAPHAPLQALDDKPFAGATNILWRAHLEDSRERARAARLGALRTQAERVDPWGLRYTALGLFAIALIAGGGDWRTRLAVGLQPGAAQSAANLIADLWIEPPDYTGAAPVYLMRADNIITAPDQQLGVPEDSVVKAQLNGKGRARLRLHTREETKIAPFERTGRAAHAQLTLSKSGVLALRLGGVETHWPISVKDDALPRAAFAGEPSVTDDGRLVFTVIIEDDYGVTDAEFAYRLDPKQARPLDAPIFDQAALDAVRSAPLDAISGAQGERTFTLNLQEDPWAGLTVLAQIILRDGAGQIGKSEEIPITLPQRPFFNPLARAVIEQRQNLSVAASDWRRTGRAFDAVTLAPEAFYQDDPTDYLMLRTAFWRVMRPSDDGFDDAIERFWPLALQLEDEALELARQRLEAAQEALRQAIERGAGAEEIARLVEELRQAMNDYLAALDQYGERTQSTADANARKLQRSDLDEMLDRIRDLAQSGAGNTARQMLSDLENVLNNLRMTQGGASGSGGGPGQSGSSRGNADTSPSGRAGEMIGRQRTLSDQTHERRRSGENADDLADEQDALSSDVGEMADQLRNQGGGDPEGSAARAFAAAREEMQDASAALANGDLDAAQSAMERAIENMRAGAEALGREQLRQAREGEGQYGRAANGRDPLGREVGVDGRGVETPEIGEGARSRQLIEELRRRLGEPGRSEEEIEYLERLLERF